MNKFLQILCYAVMFLIAYVVGNEFRNLISDEARHFPLEMPGKPLPSVLEFFSRNSLTISYLFLFPWLGFIGLPLLPRARESYWDSTLFLLRFSVFLPIELILFGVFSMIYRMPHFTLYTDMWEVVPPTWIETSMRWLFWLSVLVLVFAVVMRFIRNRKTGN